MAMAGDNTHCPLSPPPTGYWSDQSAHTSHQILTQYLTPGFAFLRSLSFCHLPGNLNSDILIQRQFPPETKTTSSRHSSTLAWYKIAQKN